MAAIDQYLRQILEATYGEEVRHSIHDAIVYTMDSTDDIAFIITEIRRNILEGSEETITIC